ncbi:hypothetical protein [Allorhodopirellula heiligendammensis]|uniref:Uncharacterized protein n=1 Tax=Allorhodopirellula heiligendammensis TaxID=2714739 RepID=A0A5C6BYU5_9BACT|nr:hypothetical protein [Allorhodopirellula heiligendammensis]TWU16446.1 hypothetical protein Poly21_36510 [Allorhodopirellula heiligendammensis]
MSPKRCLLLSTCLAALTAAPMPLAFGQDTSGPGAPPANPTQLSDSSPSGISDWALAGVVWSDASLTRKLAADALGQAQSDGAASPTQESLQQLAQQSQQIIKALEQFGWSHKKSGAQDAAPTADPTPAPSVAAEASPVADTPSTQEIMAEKMRAARARGEAEAAAASPLKPLPTLSNRVSERDGQTLSDTLPYSAGSIYDHGDYRPGGSYLSDAPVPVDASKVYTGELDDIEREVDREKSAARAQAEREQDKQPKVDPRVTAGLLRRIQMDDYTTAPQSDTGDSGDHADSRWVQFRLEANQWTYSRVNASQRIPAARAALRQLQATAMTAGRSTQDARLKQILAPIMKLSL